MAGKQSIKISVTADTKRFRSEMAKVGQAEGGMGKLKQSMTGLGVGMKALAGGAVAAGATAVAAVLGGDLGGDLSGRRGEVLLQLVVLGLGQEHQMSDSVLHTQQTGLHTPGEAIGRREPVHLSLTHRAQTLDRLIHHQPPRHLIFERVLKR